MNYWQIIWSIVLHSASCNWCPVIREVHHTIVLVLISAPGCPCAYHCCFVFKILWFSLYFEVTIYETEERDLCICTYYFWQMTGRMAKRGHDRNKGALEVASNVGEGGNVRLAFDPPLSWPGLFELQSNFWQWRALGLWKLICNIFGCHDEVSCLVVHPFALWVRQVINCLHLKIGKDYRTDLLTYCVVSRNVKLDKDIEILPSFGWMLNGSN